MKSVVFNNVTKSFEDKKVLNGLSFSVNKGETLSIMGPSGCGKTTILNLLLGLIKPDGGKIEVPKKISVVFQEDRLFEEFSALSNVEAVIPNNADKEHCGMLLEAVGIEDLKKPVCKFSGGMKRRVAIARALAADADFYILDEPFKGLDKSTKQTVMSIVKNHLSGKTLLLITHSIDEATFFGSDILTLETIE